MFKEFLVGAALCFVLWLILRRVISKNGGALPIIPVIILAGLMCVASAIYNYQNILPDTYMETSTGVYRYGTLSGNLFAYSDEFRYRDEILFPLLRGRTVTLGGVSDGNVSFGVSGANPEFYARFFEMFSNGMSEARLSVSPETILRLRSDNAFDYSTPFNCIGLMDYAKDYVPATLYHTFKDKVFPDLFINTASLKGEEKLVVIVAEDYSVYLMGEGYFNEVYSK